MAKVEIYTQPWCGYCFRAKRLPEEKAVDDIEGAAIGGSDSLAALAASGALDRLPGVAQGS